MDGRAVFDDLHVTTLAYRSALIDLVQRHELRDHEVALISKTLEAYFPSLLADLRSCGLSNVQVIAEFTTKMRGSK